MDVDHKQQQLDAWNGTMGENWVLGQDFIDNMLRPFKDILLEAVVPHAPRNILDVGCGNGATTLDLKDMLGPDATCTGIDISEPMITNARRRADVRDLDVTFIQGDAGEYAFAEGGLDLVMSRFGAMFFAAPEAAFAHLRRATGTGGRLALLVWGEREANPFLTAGFRAAAPLLPPMPKPDPTAPGPFSLSDTARAEDLFRRAGWSDVSTDIRDVTSAFPAADLEQFRTKLAPIGHDLDTLDPAQKAEIEAAVGAAYDDFIDGDAVRFSGRCVLIEGCAG